MYILVNAFGLKDKMWAIASICKLVVVFLLDVKLFNNLITF